MPDRNPSKQDLQKDGSNPVGLTAKQALVLQAIETLTAFRQYPPTYAEIGEATKSHKQVVKNVVDRLCYVGLLTRNDNEARTLVRTERPYFVKTKKQESVA